MKAARIHSFGPPDVVVIEDVPVPSPSPGEVLVRVMAAGVAPWDAIMSSPDDTISITVAIKAVRNICENFIFISSFN